MIPVALDVLRGLFALLEVAALAVAVTFAVAVMYGEGHRFLRGLRYRRRARTTVREHGLRLVQPDEVTQARHRRDRRGGAA